MLLRLLPNFPQNGFLNYINLNPEINSTRDDEIKVDQIITDKIHLTGEYLDDAQTNDNPNNTWLGSPWPTNTSPITTSNSLAQAQLTWIFSRSMVNTVSVNMNLLYSQLERGGPRLPKKTSRASNINCPTTDTYPTGYHASAVWGWLGRHWDRRRTLHLLTQVIKKTLFQTNGVG